MRRRKHRSAAAWRFVTAGDGTDFGTGASVNNVTAWTGIMWVKMETLSTGRAFFGKHDSIATGWFGRFNDGVGNVILAWSRATTNFSQITTSAPMAALNVWRRVVMGIDQAVPEAFMWVGTKRDKLVAATMAAATAGSGAYSSDAAIPLRLMSRGPAGAPGNTLEAVLGPAAFFDRRLTLAEAEEVSLRMCRWKSCRGLWLAGDEGRGGRILDWSGNGNHGTVIGGTLAEAPDVSPAFTAAPRRALAI